LQADFIEGLLTADFKRTLMRVSIAQAILVLIISTAFICPIHAGCSGSCAISGGSSYDFLGDPSFDPNMDMSNDFVGDNLDRTPLGQSPLSTKSRLPESQSTNLSINQTNNDNVSLNSTAAVACDAMNTPGRGVPDNKTAKLEGAGAQDVKQSALALTIFDNKL
jgi:hypothetical protein